MMIERIMRWWQQKQQHNNEDPYFLVLKIFKLVSFFSHLLLCCPQSLLWSDLAEYPLHQAFFVRDNAPPRFTPLPLDFEWGDATDRQGPGQRATFWPTFILL